MKTKSIMWLIAGLAAAALLTGCSSVLDTPASGEGGISAGKGAVQLTIGDSPVRTAFPAMTGITYEVSCVKGGDTKTTSFTGSSGSIELAPGTWDITVNAKNSSDTLIASATLPGITVTAGKATEVSVRLAAATGAANGTFAWAADFPDTLDSATLAYSGAATVSVDINKTVTDTEITVAGTRRSGTLSLTPGVYLVTINLAKGGKTAGDVVAVHVYSGLTTTKNDWVFTADSLIASKPLAVSVDIVPSSGVTVNSVSLTLNGDGGMVEKEDLPLSNSGGNTWTIDTSVPDTANTLSWELAITTGSATHTAQATGVAYNANLILSAINIYTLTANVGANGSLSVNGTAYAEVREFLGGTEVTLTAAPSGAAYELDSMTVNSVVQTSPHNFAISGDTTVVVTFKEKAGVDPNLIWEWSYDSDGWTDITNNTVATVKEKSIAVSGVAANKDSTNEGISFGRLAIGTTMINGGTPANATTASIYDPNGEFDFSGTRKIQITVGYKVVVAAARNLRICLNNNTTTNNATVLTPDPLIQAALTTGTAVGSYTLTGTIDQSSLILSGSVVGATKDDVLGSSFIGINMTGSGGTILITSIKIEYVPEAPPSDIIWKWQIGDNMTWTGGNGGAISSKDYRANANPNINTTTGFQVPARMAIGSTMNLETTSTTVCDSNGDFDFWEDGTKQFKVTAKFKVAAVGTSTNRTLSLVLNNNQTTGTASAAVHTPTILDSKIFGVIADFPVDTVVTLSGVIDPATITLTTQFKALAENDGKSDAELKEQVLKSSFIGLLFSGTGGNWDVRCESIVIEYNN